MERSSVLGARSSRAVPSPSSDASVFDRRTAEATIPRGVDRDDHVDTRPAVDPDVWLLHVRLQDHDDDEALEALVDEYRPYALSIARRLSREGESLEDLQQVALEALVATLRRFDCRRGIPFPAFATPTIVGALKRHYRDYGWALRVPRAVHDITAPARAAAEALTMENGRVPTVAEVAHRMGVAEEDLLLAQEAVRARSTVSLDAPARDDGTRGVELPAADEQLELADGRAALSAAIEHLDPRSRTVLGLYFFEEQSQSQIAERYGVSQMQVSRWISAALSRLRSRMRPDVDDPAPLVAA
jgi:RNA polymerase sigma-B factor